MKTLLFVLPCLILLSTACKPKKSVGVEINENGVPVVYVEEITEKGELKLSDLVEDLEIVRLETNEDCLIDNIMTSYVSGKYIIISTLNKGIYLFSRDGKFIKTIAKQGNGPGEVMGRIRIIEFNPSNNKLYVVNQRRLPPQIISFGILTNESRRVPFKQIANTGEILLGNLIRQGDSTLLISVIPFNDTIICRIVAQTTSGEILWKLNHNNPGATHGDIYQVNNNIYFNYSFGGDTLFKLEDRILSPTAIFKSDRSYFDVTVEEFNIGEITLSYSVINDRLIRGSYSIITDIDEEIVPGNKIPVFGKRASFIFDFTTSKAFLIDQIQDDFLGSEQIFSRVQKNGICSSSFQPHEILTLDEKLQKDQEIDPEIKDRVHKLAAEIDINDNPILLIAKMK